MLNKGMLNLMEGKQSEMIFVVVTDLELHTLSLDQLSDPVSFRGTDARLSDGEWHKERQRCSSYLLLLVGSKWMLV